jgi:hypothetical protein
MTTDQDLALLFQASEAALLNGRDRDAVRQAAQRLEAALKPSAPAESAGG